MIKTMIIGISGPPGAGKDTAASFIEEKFEFKHISGGDVLRELLRKIGFEPKKEAVGNLGTLLRNNYGADAILKLVMERSGSDNIIINGFRSPEEARLIKEAGGMIMYIEASDDLRHERISARGRGENLESIKRIDKKEAHSTNKLAESLIDVRSMADCIIINNGSIDEFYKAISSAVANIIKVRSA